MTEQPEGMVQLEATEPELRVVVSVGSQGGGAAHQVIVQEMKNFESLWTEATAVAVKLSKLSPVPTTDLDKEEIKKALAGEPLSISVVCKRQGKTDEFGLGCKPKDAAEKMGTLGLLITDWIEYEDNKAAKLKGAN